MRKTMISTLYVGVPEPWAAAMSPGKERATTIVANKAASKERRMGLMLTEPAQFVEPSLVSKLLTNS